MNGRALDRKVIACSLKGIQMEEEHPEWGLDFFRKFVKEYYQGFGMFSLAFFRVIILSWVLFSVIDFGIISRFQDKWSSLGIASVSVAVFTFAALFLWKVGCSPYYLLRAKAQKAIA